MTFANLLAMGVIVIGIPLNMVVTLMLWERYRQAPEIKVLRERFITAVIVLVVVVIFGLVFLNNDTLPPPLNTDLTKLITRLAMFGVAVVPAGYWLILYIRSGK